MDVFRPDSTPSSIPFTIRSSADFPPASAGSTHRSIPARCQSLGAESALIPTRSGLAERADRATMVVRVERSGEYDPKGDKGAGMV